VLQPFLFIGVGGSGGDTLRHLYRELHQRLRGAGITRMPSGWQFLHIDTRAGEEYADGLPVNPNSAYVGLAARNVTYQTLVGAVERRPNTVKAAYAGWRPDPKLVHVAIEEGAGQYRAIGRAVAVHQMQQINNKISTAAQRVEQTDARASLDEVAAALVGHQGGGTAPAPVAIVFSSLAGGTGSGTFLDVCDLLRGLDRTWTDNSVAVLYAPDVFGELRDDLRRGVQANALATVSELMAGHWLADPGPDPVHLAAGAVFKDMRRSGPAHSFMVGAGNGTLAFHHQQDVFAVVARSVAAWATSPAIQQQFSSYVQSNWQQGADRPDPLKLVDKPVDMPFSALGYASVGLGRELFRAYSTQCLARATADRLLNGTGSGELAAADVEAVVLRRKDEFARSALGLVGPQHSLVEKLNPHRRDALDVERATIQSAMGTVPRELREWGALLPATIEERRGGFLANQASALHRLAEAWVQEVQLAVGQEVRKSLASDGLVVTDKLVRVLVEHLTKQEVPALGHVATQDEQKAGRYAAEINQGLGPEPPKGLLRGRKLFPADNERVLAGLRQGVEAAMGRGFDAIVRTLCAQLLRDFTVNLLQPLSAELTQAVHALRKDSTAGADGRPALISQWPQGPAYPVPVALRPSRTQFLVDPVDGYPATFTELMCGAVGAQLPGDAVAKAVRLVLEDDIGEGGSAIRLVEQTATWQPEAVREWSGREKVEQAATFRVRASGVDLLARCDAWLGAAPRLGQYLRQTLADALGGTNPDIPQQERLARFLGRLEQAIVASAPLVRLDTAYTATHLDAAEAAYRPLISPIPLAPGTPAYEQTKQLLVRHLKIDEERVAGQFSTTGSSEVEFTSFLNAPCHPMAFASLTEPIQGDWQTKRGESGKRAGFARWRRARPLPRAIPLPRDERRAMVRGWLIAFATRDWLRIDDGERLVMGTPLTGPLSFQLLGEPPAPDDAFDTLAAVLEALPLVLIEHLDPPTGSLPSYRELLALESRVDELALVEGGALAGLTDTVHRLAADAGRRFPTVVPLGADRTWDLREDVLDSLAVLTDKLTGRTR
jgi:hypothetical protein